MKIGGRKLEVIRNLIDFILHIDDHLFELVTTYGTEVYLFLFIIIFIETGVVIMPFLPGDSLIFAGAALAANGSLNIFLLFFIVFFAAVIGDTTNYHIGEAFGNKLINSNNRFIKKEYIDKTTHFFERHGGKSIVIARFVPIIRTFAPFVAGIGTMHYWKFLSYNVVGAGLWTLLFCVAGYFFGNIPFVKNNFSMVILAIIAISLLPAVIGAIKAKIGGGKKQIPEKTEEVK